MEPNLCFFLRSSLVRPHFCSPVLCFAISDSWYVARFCGLHLYFIKACLLFFHLPAPVSCVWVPPCQTSTMFPVFCCSYPNWFEMCCCHQIQNKQIWGKISLDNFSCERTFRSKRSSKWLHSVLFMLHTVSQLYLHITAMYPYCLYLSVATVFKKHPLLHCYTRKQKICCYLEDGIHNSFQMLKALQLLLLYCIIFTTPQFKWVLQNMCPLVNSSIVYIAKIWIQSCYKEKKVLLLEVTSGINRWVQ